MFGRMYFKRPAVIAWVLNTIGFNMLYFPLFIAGYLGMPRRYYDYLPEFAPYHLTSMVGSWVLVLGLTIMAVNIIVSIRRGAKAPADPWGGVTLEWTIPSPPPMENFHAIPEMKGKAYDFSKYEKPLEAK
jgi:cytochrome c oxidase subunit 1